VPINIFRINNDPNVWSNHENWDLEQVLNNESLDMGIKNLSIMPLGAGKRMCAGITHVLNWMLPYLLHLSLKSKDLPFKRGCLALQGSKNLMPPCTRG
jgi:hypothetical protein